MGPPGQAMQTTIGLLRDHRVVCWGHHGLIDTPGTSLVPVPDLTDAVDLDGVDYTCILRKTGALRCWLNRWSGTIPGELRSLASRKPHDLESPTGLVHPAARRASSRAFDSDTQALEASERLHGLHRLRPRYGARSLPFTIAYRSTNAARVPCRSPARPTRTAGSRTGLLTGPSRARRACAQDGSVPARMARSRRSAGASAGLAGGTAA